MTANGRGSVPAELLEGALPVAASSVTWFVPGRIEVLGKHTDYAGGRSLLAATSRGITFHAKANGEDVVRVYSDAIGSKVELPLSDTIEGFGGGHWAGYAAAVVSRLVSNFGSLVRGADIEVSSNLPLASGMSSSSAMVVGLARCLMDLSGLESDPRLRENVGSPEELAAYLACIENGMSFGTLTGHRGVGTFGGSEDHTAMLCGREGELVQYSFCPVKFEQSVPFPADHSFVVAVSGVLAEKTGAVREAYNRVSASAREIVQLWNQHTGRNDAVLADALASSAEAKDILRTLIGPDQYLRLRMEQFHQESDSFVPHAAQALKDNDLESFGEAAELSQRWTDRGLENQIDETRKLVEIALRNGAKASSAFGAGFGGSVWALVPTADAESFAQTWLADYLSYFPEHTGRASTVITRPGSRAHRLALELS